MKTLWVESRSGDYPVVVGDSLIRHIGQHLDDVHLGRDRRYVVITDHHVAAQDVSRELEASLAASGRMAHQVVIQAGDASKSLEVAKHVYDQLISFGMRRTDVILALGGGVVGDLAGFVAATFLRGVPFVQIPTTLLSHDSAIGGKVGVNLPQGKNLVGAFYPPKAVFFDTTALASLPRVQWTNGMAELIKHALIDNPELFENLERNPLTTYPGAAKLEPIIADAMQVKIDVVNSDERETGRRQVLNVGHTIGHAIEQRSHYALGHGEAVSIGLALESELAVRRGLLKQEDAVRIRRVLSVHGLPVLPPKDDYKEISRLIDVDKKHTKSHWTFALPVRIGDVQIVGDVESAEVEAVYHAALEGVTE